ncbi:MAG: hypothetical protein IKE45_04275 [Halomonas sp.]|nr:hypothetical protein [Halomonas sp.]MBR2513232.1 hypothetical protein [Halomonas sp.]
MSRRQIHPIAAEPLNTLLAQKAQDSVSFTICELRDELLEQPDLAGFDQRTLRSFVRDQINKRVKRGDVERVGLHPCFKQRYLFQVVKAFNSGNDHSGLESAKDSTDVEPLTTQLRRDSEQLRAQMEASHLQLQALQEIADKYPDARDKISLVFEEEKAQARALGEKLKAYAKVQQMLAEVGDEA